MRIAHFVHRYPPALGGAEAYFARLSRYLAAAGHEVTVFTTNALSLDSFWSARGKTVAAGVTTEDGVEVRRYPLVHWPEQRYWLKVLSLVPIRSWQCLTLPCNPMARGMWRDAVRAELKFDVVHATAFPYSRPIMCALRLARRLRVPFLITPFVHLGDPDKRRDKVRRAYTSRPLLYLLRAADGIFVQTELERAALIKCGIANNKLILQGMGVDPVECTGGNRERTRRDWEMAKDDVVIGHLANNSREKGSVDLLRAAEKLWPRHRFRLILAGPEMRNFRNFWNGYKSSERVRRLGVLSEQQKRDFYAAIDIFALPSRVDSFGLVLLEAWANGVPNVAYRAGGVPAVIRHDKDGLLSRCGDIDGLARTLSLLIDNAEQRRLMGEAGRERIKDEFQWQQKLRIVERGYAKSLSE